MKKFIKKNKENYFLKKNKQTGLIHLQCTQNNTIITLTDNEGNTKYWASAGCLGFKNSRKSTPYAAQAVAEKISKNALKLGIYHVTVKMKGLGYGKKNAVRTLSKSGLKILKIEDRTPLPHNGCRPSKKRRV
jgi:small subunit ribosomal protein S11